MAKSARKPKSVSKAELVGKVAEQADMKKKDVKSVIDAVLESIGDHLARGNKVQLTGFGTFEVRERKSRTGVRPGTTEKIQIPAASYPAFKPGKGLKDRVQE